MKDKLAKHGGEPTRLTPPPFREAMGPSERDAVLEVLNHYTKTTQDPPYEGIFQKKLELWFS